MVAANGFPVRLIAPGWYGIANVKRLQHIDVLPTCYENWFMARDYVTIREQQIVGQTLWTQTAVRCSNLRRPNSPALPASIASWAPLACCAPAAPPTKVAQPAKPPQARSPRGPSHRQKRRQEG